MATAMQQRGSMQPYRGGSGYVARSSSSGLYDVLELILDKGLVIDVFVRVSLIGIEILTIDARDHDSRVDGQDLDPDQGDANRDRERRHLPALRRGGQPARLDVDRDAGTSRVDGGL